MSPISTDRTWNARAESDGTLVRDGEIGDLVAWVVEHEGKVGALSVFGFLFRV